MGGSTFDYWLPHTVMRFSGRTSTTEDSFFAPTETTVEYDAAAACVEVADPGFEFGVDLSGTALQDVSGTLEFTEDRRLSSISGDSSGTAGAVVGQVTRFVSGLVGAAASVVTSQVPIRAAAAAADPGSHPRPAPPDPDKRYVDECPDAAEQRAQVRAAIDALRGRILATASGTGSPADLRGLISAYSSLLQLQVDANAHFAAWRAAKKQTTAVASTFDVSLLDLPHTHAVAGSLHALDKRVLGRAWDAYDALGVFASVEGDRPHDRQGPEPRSVQKGIFYRLPRLVWLSIYARSDGKPTARLIERRPQWVFDSLSATGFLSLESGIWGKKSVAATLDRGSAPQKVTIGSAGGAAAVANALGGAVEQATKGIADANSLAAGFNTVRDAGLDRQLALLDKRKSLIEKRVATDNAKSDVADLRELQRLQHQIDVLEADSTLHDLKSPPAAASADEPTTRRVVITLE